MRDVRYNTREFTDPIIFTTQTETVIDYVNTKVDGVSKTVFGEVMVDYQNMSSQNGSQVQTDGIKVKILKPQDFVVVVQNTKMEVDSVKYTVTSVEPYATNTEFLFVRGKLAIDG